MDIFNWFGSILGYLLWFLYEIVQNYGIATVSYTHLDVYKRQT